MNDNHWHSFYQPQIAALQDEISRLREVIENAPHDDDNCEHVDYDGYVLSLPCTCWKKQVV